LYPFLTLLVNIKAMGNWHPLCSIDEFFSKLIASTFITDDPSVNINIINSQAAVFVAKISINVFWINLSIWFNSLRSRLSLEMVFAIKSLMALDCLL